MHTSLMLFLCNHKYHSEPTAAPKPPFMNSTQTTGDLSDSWREQGGKVFRLYLQISRINLMCHTDTEAQTECLPMLWAAGASRSGPSMCQGSDNTKEHPSSLPLPERGSEVAGMSSFMKAASIAWLKEFWKLGTGTRSELSLSPSLSTEAGGTKLFSSEKYQC